MREARKLARMVRGAAAAGMVVVLACATPVRGADLGASRQGTYGGAVAEERFVPGTQRFWRGATLEMRTEARVIGAEVKLKQICRWSDADATVFAPIADLVVTRLDTRLAFRTVSMEEVKSLLQDAGVNLAVIRFAGATSCSIGRSDAQLDERAALEQWISSKESSASPTRGATGADIPVANHVAVAAAVAQPATVATQAEPPKAHRNLRELLVADLCARLRLAPEAVQMQFSPQDERVLNLSEALFRFNIEPRRVRDLGEVAWDVQVVTGTGAKKVTINATARVWEQQMVVTRAVAARQTIREDDISLRRTLVDRLSDEPAPLMATQVVGSQAAMELKPGTVLTARLIEAVPMVRSGQLVSISVAEGGIEIKTVAKAMETGSYGQTIRVRNEATRQTFDVVVTGPQTARLGGARGGPALASDEGRRALSSVVE